jgi:hypothetical protein
VFLLPWCLLTKKNPNTQLLRNQQIDIAFSRQKKQNKISLKQTGSNQFAFSHTLLLPETRVSMATPDKAPPFLPNIPSLPPPLLPCHNIFTKVFSQFLTWVDRRVEIQLHLSLLNITY